MPMAAIKSEIETSLFRIDERLREVGGRLAEGSAREKVEAAGELDFLRQQKHDLEQRLARLDHLPDGTWATIYEWLREEASILERRIAGWIVRR
jgi:hypothetical protein